MTELNVRDLLDELAAAPPPATSVDVERAVGAGRRRVTRRRRTAVGGVALTVCLVLGGAVGLSTLDRDHRPAPAEPLAARASFDPLVPYASFGWLPAGLSDRETRSRRHLLVLEASDPAKAGGQQPPAVTLTVAPKGARLFDSGWRLFATAPVNGRPALGAHEPAPPVAGALLRWEYAEEAWAELTVYASAGDPEPIARRVAERVRFAAADRLRLPFAPAAVVAGMPPEDVTVTWRGPQEWTVSVQYGVDTGRGTRPGWPLRISVRPGRERYRSGNTTLDGRPALHRDRPANEQLIMTEDVGWLWLRMEARGETTIPPGGLLGVYGGLRFTPDPANWE